MIKTVDNAIRVLKEVKAILKLNVSDAKYKAYEENIVNIMGLLNKLKKENEAYKEMWKHLTEHVNHWSQHLDIAGFMRWLEQKYLGGGE
jgi:hypothetical protein